MSCDPFIDVITKAGIYFLPQKTENGEVDNKKLYDAFLKIHRFFESKGVIVPITLSVDCSKEKCFDTGNIKVRFFEANDDKTQDNKRNSISRLAFDLSILFFDNSFNQLLSILTLVEYDVVYGLYLFLKKTYLIANSESIKYAFECNREFCVDQNDKKYIWKTGNIKFDAYNNDHSKDSIIVIKVNDEEIESEAIKSLIAKLLEIHVIISA